MELIDAGLEELEEEDGVILAYANYIDFGNMNNKFEELGIELTKAELKKEFQIILKNLQKHKQEDIGKLIENLKMTMMFKQYIQI